MENDDLDYKHLWGTLKTFLTLKEMLGEGNSISYLKGIMESIEVNCQNLDYIELVDACGADLTDVVSMLKTEKLNPNKGIKIINFR